VFLAALLALGGCAVPQRDAARSRDSSHGSPPAELSQNHLEAESKELKLAIQEESCLLCEEETAVRKGKTGDQRGHENI
jgi:hypothetical protein